jgi:hypothetical protein
MTRRYEKSELGDPDKWRSWATLRGKSLTERLELYTYRGGPNECWPWSGAVSNGYGRITGPAPERKKFLVHRVAYEAANGPIPDGMFIDHRCHNKLCVNPAHLRVVTNKQNSEHAAGPLSNNVSGFLGVHKSSPNRWRGKVKHNGKDYYTARFTTPEAADEAVRKLRLELFTHNDLDRAQ